MEEASPDSSTSARPSRLVYGGAVAIVLAGLLLRLAVSPSYGYMGNESDLIEQKQAIHRAITLGIHEIYTLNAENDPAIAGGEWQGGYFINWPPVIVYLRYVPVWVYKQFYPLAFEYWNSEENYFRMVRTNINRRLAWSRGYTVVVKLPGILADCILALALFSYAARRTTPKLALVMAAAYTFNPGLIIESAHWGQPDAVWAALLVLSLGLLHHGKLEWALVAYALAGLTKPQPAAFFLLILYLSLAGGAFRRLLAGGTLAVATGLLVYFPFLVHGTFVESISSMLQSIFGGEPFIACNANNLWWLLSGGRGYEISDLTPVIASLSARNLGLIGFLSANVFAIWRLHSWRKWHEDAPTLFLAASFVIMSFFMFNTELHENHMMAVVPLLAFSLPGDSRRWLPFALLSTTFLLNLVLFDLSLVNGLYRLGIAPLPLKALSVANAALNTVGYGVVGWLFWQATRPSAARTRSPMSKLWVTAVLLAVTLTCIVVYEFRSGTADVEIERDAAATATQLPNVLMIVIDTLRADHLGTYGYQRDTSPAIDRFAQENTKYTFAISTAPWTSPSVASIFTGLYPTAHGMTRAEFSSDAEIRASVLSNDLETLAETLKKAGYHTIGLSSNPRIRRQLGFAQGFDDFRVLRSRNAYSSAERVTANAKRKLAELDSDSPFFLYVHYMDPHTPLKPPVDFNRYFPEQLLDCACPDDVLTDVDLYDREIRYLDSAIGSLFAFVKVLNLYDDMVIVFMGDHGTAFMEHGAMHHGRYLYNVDTRVPLIIKSGDEPREVDVAVSLVDVYPTLLDILGIPLGGPIQGVSLLGQLERRMARGVMMEEGESNHKAYVRNSGEKLILDFHSGLALSGGGADGGPKLLASEADEVGVVGLFDIRKDDLEQHPITHDELTEQMRREFYAIFNESVEIRRRRANDTSTTALSIESIEALRALGYIRPTSSSAKAK